MKLLITIAAILSLASFTSTAKNKTAGNEPRSFARLLWEGEAPHRKIIKPDAAGNIRQPVNIGDTAKLYVFLPAPEKANGKAVVLCPGGAYLGLCMDYEGG